jgi:hypothetical protein
MKTKISILVRTIVYDITCFFVFFCWFFFRFLFVLFLFVCLFFCFLFFLCFGLFCFVFYFIAYFCFVYYFCFARCFSSSGKYKCGLSGQVPGYISSTLSYLSVFISVWWSLVYLLLVLISKQTYMYMRRYNILGYLQILISKCIILEL